LKNIYQRESKPMNYEMDMIKYILVLMCCYSAFGFNAFALNAVIADSGYIKWTVVFAQYPYFQRTSHSRSVDKSKLLQDVNNYLEKRIFKKNNYHIFLNLMMRAGYPPQGADAIIKFRKEYINAGKGAWEVSRRKGELIKAAASLPKLARVIVPELKEFVKKSPSSWIVKYGPYWCKAAKIDDPGFFKNKIPARFMPQYIVLWAKATGDGDKAYTYAQNNLKNMNMLNLLDSDCNLSRGDITKILEVFFSRPLMMHRISSSRRFRKTLTPNAYPVLDEILEKKYGDKVGWLYPLVLNPRAYLVRHGDLHALKKGRLNGKIVYPRDATNWATFIHRWNMQAYFFTKKRKQPFFELLWSMKGNPRVCQRMVSGGTVVIPLLLKKIKDNKPHSSIVACNIISDMGTSACKDASGPLLVKLKNSDSYLVRSAIIRAMIKIKAVNAVSELKRLSLNEKNKIVRDTAMRALVSLSKK
jgi:hypothetical protein